MRWVIKSLWLNNVNMYVRNLSVPVLHIVLHLTVLCSALVQQLTALDYIIASSKQVYQIMFAYLNLSFSSPETQSVLNSIMVIAFSKNWPRLRFLLHAFVLLAAVGSITRNGLNISEFMKQILLTIKCCNLSEILHRTVLEMRSKHFQALNLYHLYLLELSKKDVPNCCFYY